MVKNAQDFEYPYSEEWFFNLGYPLSGRDIYSYPFSFLKKGFPPLFLTQWQPKK